MDEDMDEETNLQPVKDSKILLKKLQEEFNLNNSVIHASFSGSCDGDGAVVTSPFSSPGESNETNNENLATSISGTSIHTTNDSAKKMMDPSVDLGLNRNVTCGSDEKSEEDKGEASMKSLQNYRSFNTSEKSNLTKNDEKSLEISIDLTEAIAMEKCKIGHDDMLSSQNAIVTVERNRTNKRTTDHTNNNSDEMTENIESTMFSDAKKQRRDDGTYDSAEDHYVDARGDKEDMESNKEQSPTLETPEEAKVSSSDSDSEQSTYEDADDKVKCKKELEEEEEAWLKKDIGDLPLPNWRAVQEIRRRQTLRSSHYWPYKVCGAYGMVKRFELDTELSKHEGCVNALHFNQSGRLLASGSDDLKIMLWDWARSKNHPEVMYESGHKSNVFQAKFLPGYGDNTVVSSARDGQVRIAHISSAGSCRNTKKVAQHRGAAHKIAVDTDQQASVLSCGEDGVVFGIDLRQDRTDKLLTIKANDRKVPLYSIHTNPLRTYEFAVSGRDAQARIFDRRMLLETDETTEPLKLYCPHHLEGVSDIKANITSLVYNWNGSELLCSYNDEDIYLFDTNHSTGADYIRRYKGHRNSATVKGVNFYGPRSEFIVSGSDCGNIFFWEKTSSRVVGLLEGDNGGVVNVLEPHPNLPVLATSGLDHEVKIWTPTADALSKSDKLLNLKQCMLSNRRSREDDRNSVTDMIDGHMLWFLMRSLRSRSRRPPPERGDTNDTTDDDDSASSSDFESGDDGPIERCTQS